MADWRDQVRGELDALTRRQTARALWRRHPSAWVDPSPGGTPAGDATGWLDLPQHMAEFAVELPGFADKVRADGYTDVVLLGMGGSSLGPLVLGRVFGTAPGYLTLHVLDSTVPGQIAAVRDRVDLRCTLFMVSSKSGTTIESLTLLDYFRGLLGSTGVEAPDAQFVAVTDPGTPLETLAHERGFRRVFNSPVDVGGRFSVLSRFGLLPAALIGVDLKKLLPPVVHMATACRADADPLSNPGALVGATLGGPAKAGRDKITIMTSPRLESFSLWVEQLIAESTGKNGRGLIPVVGESLFDASEYGNDRNFVYVRLSGDDNAHLDAHADALQAAGHPVTRLQMNDTHELGAEFFRWEFAVAVAATSIAVYPFDQPDVESGKEFTRNLLSSPDGARGTPSVAHDSGDVVELISKAQPGDYVAIIGYLPESPEVENAVSELRAAITRKMNIATTFGYGPRYLHSTGQLHKGGPDGVIVLALGAGNEEALAAPGAEIPGTSATGSGANYGFESLFEAQMLGDLKALHSKGRRNTLTVLKTPYENAIRDLASSLNAAPW